MQDLKSSELHSSVLCKMYIATFLNCFPGSYFHVFSLQMFIKRSVINMKSLTLEWLGGRGSLLIELLAKEGYLIVATPYSLSFDHTVSAQGIHTRFNTCLQYLSATGLGSLSAEEISKLPVFSVGHRYIPISGPQEFSPN